MRAGLIAVLLAGCASSGWVEGAAIDAEVDRALAAGTGGEMGLAVPSGTYAVPPGELAPERRALFDALLAARGARTPAPARRAFGSPPPDRERAIHAWPSPEVVEIEYGDHVCRVHRIAFRDDRVWYTVQLAGGPYRNTHQTGFIATPKLESAWARLVREVERGATHVHLGMWVYSRSPLAAIREAVVDYRGTAAPSGAK